jgi:rubrerythrin
MREPTALQMLDNLMARLIEADQTGSGTEPLALAQELGRIRASLARGPIVRRTAGGKMHFRCEICGTIVHDDDRPARCPECGGEKLARVDLSQPDVDAGPA